MDVTVSICTWNRAALLDGLLCALARVSVPAATSWEVLVVDNASTDDTAQVIDRHRASLPLRSVLEPVAGHSHARNRVVDCAAGDLILWLDADVLVDPGWLSAWSAAARAWPHASYFGGPVEPWYMSAPPRWLVENLDLLSGSLAILQLGDDVRPFAEDETPFGANMAVRREAIRELRFDPRLGLVGEKQIRGEEIELVDRLRARGATGVWVGNAPVKHLVPRQRMTARYVWRYFVGYGRTAVRRGLHGLGDLHGVPDWMGPRYRLLLRRAALGALTGRGQWVRPFVEAAQLNGTMLELRASPAAAATR